MPASHSMEGPVQTSRVLPGRSCNACRRRKIRCDRQKPCGYCTKLRLSCTYTDAARGTTNPPESDALSRLARIEASVNRLEARLAVSQGQQPPKIIQVSDLGTTPAGESTATPGRESGKLVLHEGDARYVTSSFWADLDEADEDDCPAKSEPSTCTPARHHDFVFGFRSATQDLLPLHPEESLIFALWQIFLENVDPVLKIIHVPVTQRQILRASRDLANIPPTFEALMFAIYYAAVTSIQRSASAAALLPEDQNTLLDRYQFGVEQALARANFMTASDIPSLQALTLYLVSARQSSDKAYVWSMTGLLIRLAMRLGLHRDAAALGLSPFMSEIRRRLWWQICILDIRIAEDNDTDPFIYEHSFDTKFPANLNDADLDVNMTQLPVPTVQRSEMLFTLIRFEVSYAARKLVFSSKFTADNGYPDLSLREKHRLLESVLRDLEDKYLQQCDNNIPICFLAATIAKMVLAKIKLTIYHPVRNGPLEMDHEQLTDLVTSGIDIIEYAHSLRSDEKYARWVWLFETYLEWDAVAFLLHTLGAVRLTEFRKRAWKAVEVFFDNWQNHAPGSERRWRRLERLKVKAMAARSNSQTDLPGPTSNTPTSEGNGESSSTGVGSRVSAASITGQIVGHGSELLGQRTLGEEFDWNFDNIPYVQEAPDWDMDVDVNLFNSWA